MVQYSRHEISTHHISWYSYLADNIEPLFGTVPQGDDRWNCQRSNQGQGWLWSCSKCTPSSFSSAWSSSTALTSASTSPPSSSMYTKIFPWWATHQEKASKLFCSIWGVSLVIRLPDPFAVGSLINNWSGNMTMPLGVHTIFFVRIFSRLRHETHVADVYLDSSKPCRQCRVLFGGSIYFLQCSLLWFRNRWSLQTSRSVFHVILLFITFWLQILSSDYHLMLGDKILLPMLITWLLQNPPPPHYHHLIITKPFSLWSSLGVYLLPMLITWLLQNPPHLMITNWCLVITKPSSPRSSLGVSLDHFARPHLQSKYLPPPFRLEIVVFHLIVLFS